MGKADSEEFACRLSVPLSLVYIVLETGTILIFPVKETTLAGLRNKGRVEIILKIFADARNVGSTGLSTAREFKDAGLRNKELVIILCC